jgi:hydrogenase nickel incorporation protein HypB
MLPALHGESPRAKQNDQFNANESAMRVLTAWDGHETSSTGDKVNTRVLEIRKGILNKNDEIARRLRNRLHDAGVLTVNMVSSPGSGKTTLLERTLRTLREQGSRPAALVGDLATDNDARRLAGAGVPVKQINTAGRCHLEAQMISDHLDDWDLSDFDYLFIENVGNLVCPSSYDLGEDFRVVLLSVTEGEDKPLKYPGIFNSADIAVITKIDLAAPCDFDLEAAVANIQAVRPGMQILTTSAKSGEGMERWIDALASRRQTREMNLACRQSETVLVPEAVK